MVDGPLVMLRWSQIRARFPKYEQVAPLPPSVETFDSPQEPRFEFQFNDVPPTPRLLMINEPDTEVLQIQEDKLGYSWRKLRESHEYPHYNYIRQRFEEEFLEFQVFLREENRQIPRPNQCEVTYVNLISPGGVWATHADLGKIIPSAAQRLSEGFLPSPEQTRYTSQYVIQGGEGHALGRLYVSAEPSYEGPDRTPIYVLRLTARGAPQGPELAEILKTMDMGHQWVVRGFATLTSSDMHEVWRRTSWPRLRE